MTSPKSRNRSHNSATRRSHSAQNTLRPRWESEFENVFSSDPDRLFGGWLARPSTNVNVQFDSTGTAGERLRSLTIDGKEVDPKASYTLAAGSRTGQPEEQIHRVKQCYDTRLLERTTHDAVRSFLAKKHDIQDTGKPPLKCVVRPAVLRSQYLAFIEGSQKAREQEKDGGDKDDASNKDPSVDSKTSQAKTAQEANHD